MIWIFEGPDGAGKSILAQAVRATLPDPTVLRHHGPYPKVTDGDELAEVYFESLMPAFRNGFNVVLDRCWISEVPYGLAFRNGADRLGPNRRRVLETAIYSWNMKARVILCLPPWERVVENWKTRWPTEYLKSVSQLEDVYNWYAYNQISSLPVTVIDPFDGRDHAKEIADG